MEKSQDIFIIHNQLNKKINDINMKAFNIQF